MKLDEVNVATPFTSTVSFRLVKSLVSPTLPVTEVPARPTIRCPEMIELLRVKSSVLMYSCEPLVVFGTNIPSVAAPKTAEKGAPRPVIAPGALAAPMLGLAVKMPDTKVEFGSMVP